MGFGLNSSKSKQQQSSTQSSSQGASNVNLGSNVWGPQGDYLQDIYARAQQQGQQGYAGQGALGQAGNALNAAQSGYQNILGAGMDPQAMGAMQQAQQGLQGIMQNAQGTDPMMGAYARQLGQQFNEQIMPSIRDQGMQVGQLGGSRQQLAAGTAAGQMGRQMQDFGAQLYGQQQDRALNAAGQMGQLGNMFNGAWQQSQALKAKAAEGLGMTGQQFGQLAGQQAAAPWFNLSQYGALVGPGMMQNLGGYGNSWGESSGSSQGTGSSSSFGMQGKLW